MHIVLILENYLKRTNPFIRFLMVGVINTLVGLSIMFGLLHLVNLSYWLSTFIGNTVGAFVSYLLNRSFTFHSEVPHQKGVTRFLLVIGLCYIFSYGSSEFLLNRLLNKDEELAKSLAVLLGTCLYTISNYMGQKYFVFKKSSRSG